jgi:glutaredoxin
MDDFISPKKMEFTIYSKSGCENCNKVKKYLKDNKLLFTEVNCDEYLIENRHEFLEFIKNLAGKEVKVFPMVFDYDNYVGGYKETIKYCENMMDILF